MLFNSIQFLLFFPVVVALYFILPQKVRNYMLLAASFYFYMSFIPKYVFILIATTIIDYVGARCIEKYNDNKKQKKLVFIIAISLNIGMLFFFKYLGFFGDTINILGTTFNLGTVVLPKIILPIGISFHTFQSMGYLIDVYTGKEAAQKDVFKFTLFLMFFPQLVAGPIERSGNLMKQFDEKHTLTYTNISEGGRMMLWGMVKKVVIADNLAIFVDLVYNDPTAHKGPTLLLATVFFAFQIYCDFSAYSDIAIGAAQIMGFRLMKNFDTPYLSKTVGEFWRRWHISLSTWFKDYIYLPLGGNRVSHGKWVRNQLITFGISGIWHGANWTFFFWGLLNGAYIIVGKKISTFMDNKFSFKRENSSFEMMSIKDVMVSTEKFERGSMVVEKILPPKKSTIILGHVANFLRIIRTFTLITFTWVFFRANNFADAFYVINNMFKGVGEFLKIFFTNVFTAPMLAITPIIEKFPTVAESRLLISYFALILLIIVDIISGRSEFRYTVAKLAAPVRWLIYSFFIVIIVAFGAYDNKSFIYFQF